MALGIQRRLIFYERLLERIAKTHKPGSPEFYRAWMRLFDEDGTRYDGTPGGAYRRALEHFGLDVSRPEDWHILDHILAEIVFGELPRGRKKGSGEFWDRRAYVTLASLYYEIGYDVDVDEELGPLVSPKKFTNTKIADLISKRPEFSQYKSSPGEIRKRIPEALRVYGEWVESIRE